MVEVEEAQQLIREVESAVRFDLQPLQQELATLRENQTRVVSRSRWVVLRFFLLRDVERRIRKVEGPLGLLGDIQSHLGSASQYLWKRELGEARKFLEETFRKLQELKKHRDFSFLCTELDLGPVLRIIFPREAAPAF